MHDGVPGALERLDDGGDIRCSALGVAAWIHYTLGVDFHGNRHTVVDPMADTFASLHARHADSSQGLVEAFLAQEAVFSSALADSAYFSQAVFAAYRSLQECGVQKTLERLAA